VHARVVAEGGPKNELEVAGFPPAQRVRGPTGHWLLITEQQLSPGSGALGPLVITLRGLPTLGPGRWIAIALALALVLGGAASLARRRSRPDDAGRADWRSAREALLDELARLEQARRDGRVESASYPELRASLMDALACLVHRLDQDRAAEPRGSAAENRS